MLTLWAGFLIYAVSVTAFSVFMIYKISPIYGKRNPLVYLSICSLVGSVSVMAIKAFGIALKLTFNGNNQFSHASTYVFMIITGVCILTQMNYFNKALSQFPTNMYVALPDSMLSCSHALTDFRQCQPPLLRHLHDCHTLRILHPLQRLQHHRSDQHPFSSMRLPRHLHRCVPTEPVARGPQRLQDDLGPWRR